MLLAISGLAREFALKTGDKYLAGIWESDFARGLSWHVPSRNLQYPERPETDVDSAPSWSWALQECHQMRGMSLPRILDTFLTERQVGFHVPLPQLLAPTLVKAEIVPHHFHSLGRIKSGKLILEGCCRNVTILWKPIVSEGPEKNRAHIVLSTLRPTNYNQHLGIFMDNWKWASPIAERQSRIKVELKCLLLFSGAGKLFNFLYCLLLDRNVSGEGHLTVKFPPLKKRVRGFGY
jgi:hypothetical protein